MKRKKVFITAVTALGLIASGSAFSTIVSANSSDTTYDLSEWQGNLNDAQVQRLKNEVPFIILRVQYGSLHADRQFAHNRDLLDKYGIPYGVYSYSQYLNPSDAAKEARDLYNRAPNARFYVNDYEEQTVTSGGTNASTLAWVNALRPLVGNRKILFYSYASFMQDNASQAVNSYDGYWLAAYQNNEPSREHVLWQFSDHFYSAALNQNLDASHLNQKNADWFVGNNNTTPQNNSTNTANTTGNNGNANNSSANNAANTTDNNGNANNSSANNAANTTDNNGNANNSSANNAANTTDNNGNANNSGTNNTANTTNNNSETKNATSNKPKKHKKHKEHKKPLQPVQPAEPVQPVKHKKPAKHKKVAPTVSFTALNQSMTVKGGTGLKIYKHVPGDHRFAGHNGVKYASRRYAHRRVTIDLAGKRLSNGETYYRISAGLHRLGWINAKGLVQNVTYSAYHGTKTVKAKPNVAFHVHVTGSAFANDGVTHKGSQLAHHKLTLTKRAQKDGWNSYYYKAYNHHHFVGWVYQSAFK